MSLLPKTYVQFGFNSSSVYLTRTTPDEKGPSWICHLCSIMDIETRTLEGGESEEFRSLQDVWDHMEHHVNVGDTVPHMVMRQLGEELLAARSPLQVFTEEVWSDED